MSHVSQNGHPESLKQSTAELLHDVGDLAELQWELLAIDAAEARRRARWPLVAIVLAVVVLLGMAPVLLLGLAELLVLYASFAAAWAYLLVAVVAAVAAAVTVKLSIDRLGQATASFGRSRDELKQNIQWMRSVIKAQGRAERMEPVRRGVAP